MAELLVLEDELKHIHKVELHLHLGGSYPIEYLASIADETNTIELKECIFEIERGIDYHKGFRIFDLVGKIVNTDKRVEDGSYAVCQELVKDNVIYTELRTGLKDLGSGFEGYLNAVRNGVNAGCSDSNLKVSLILSLRRNSSRADARHTFELMKKYRDLEPPIVGLDISGDSSLGDAEAIFEISEEIRLENFKITLHIGETMKETPSQQIKELTIIRPDRIGHAVHLCAEAKQWIFDHLIPVEMCLSSAEKVRMVDKASDHPALEWVVAGHPVCICTDDPLNFVTTVSKECAIAAHLLGYGLEEMTALQLKSLGYRFEPVKQATEGC